MSRDGKDIDGDVCMEHRRKERKKKVTQLTGPSPHSFTNQNRPMTECAYRMKRKKKEKQV